MLENGIGGSEPGSAREDRFLLQMATPAGHRPRDVVERLAVVETVPRKGPPQADRENE